MNRFTNIQEENFPLCKEFEGSKIIRANQHQNKYEHWDWKVDGVKYEVKAPKRVKRSDPMPSKTHTYVEYSVVGYKGWIFGKADKLALEYFGEYIIVDRIKLLDLCEENIKDKKIYSTPREYGFNKRTHPNKQPDILTLVPYKDILLIADKVIK